MFSFADHQIFGGFNTHELHFPGLWSREWTNQKVSKDIDVLIDLLLDVFGNIAITLSLEALLGNAEHPSCTNLPDS